MATYKLIASSTVGSGGASSITFSSIPGTYTDLCILFSLRQDTADQAVNVRINGSTSGIYSRLVLTQTGPWTGGRSYSGSSEVGFYLDTGSDASGATANTFGNAQLYIPNYAGSNNKSLSSDMVAENNGTSNSSAALQAGLWASTSAITEISFIPWSSKFVQYSTAYLYGISNA